MSGDEITQILVGLEGLRRDVKSLAETVNGLKIAPVECSRITFTPKQVITIILFLASLNVTSGAATYYSLSSWISQPTKVAER